MGKLSKKEIRNNLESKKTIDYNSLRLDILKILIEDRDIKCKSTKESIIEHLKMDDDGEYIRPYEYEKTKENKFIIKVDMRDTETCRKIGKLIEKGDAQRLNIFSNNKFHYILKEKLL